MRKSLIGGRIMDLTIILGLLLGIGGILIGHVLDNGHVSSLVQGTAAVIVFGGTFGAVLVSSTKSELSEAFKLLKSTLFGDSERRENIALEIVDAAKTARQDTILSLEKKLSTFSDPFMKSVFRFVIDGVEITTIKDLFENEIQIEEERALSAVKVVSDAGGFAPTIGIIGAVLGLIHVMENLTDTSKLGAGIAIAFVATVYGVGSANLIFLPLANRMKRKVKERSKTKEMILQGALSIVNGVNPYIIDEKLKSYYAEKE